MGKAKAWVELVHDGTYAGTSVNLVIQDSVGNEKRYEIPHVETVELMLDARDRGKTRPMLVIGLHGVKVQATIAVGPGRMNVDDILAEIAAEHLREDKGG